MRLNAYLCNREHRLQRGRTGRTVASLLGEDPPLLDRGRHPLNGDDERRLARGAVVGLRGREPKIYRAPHVDLEAALHLVELPVEARTALDPLEVRDDHAAGVGEDVGDDRDAAIAQLAIGVTGHRTVRAFDDDPRAYRPGVR